MKSIVFVFGFNVSVLWELILLNSKLRSFKVKLILRVTDFEYKKFNSTGNFLGQPPSQIFVNWRIWTFVIYS